MGHGKSPSSAIAFHNWHPLRHRQVDAIAKNPAFIGLRTLVQDLHECDRSQQRMKVNFQDRSQLKRTDFNFPYPFTKVA